MTTLTEFFEREARTALEQLRALTAVPSPDTSAVQRAVRTIRGSAQMAREERVYRAALALEIALRPLLASGEAWSPALLNRVRAATGDLEVLVAGVEPAPELDARLRATLEAWGAIGVELPAAVLGNGPSRSADDAREFRAYAARELAGITEALAQGVSSLRAEPLDREALKAILRRQRALRGAARLEEIPVVAEILHAVEDVVRVIAKLDVGVKEEWLDCFRSAREGLLPAIAALEQDRDPPPSNALARLRHLRSELLARYGTGETVNAGARAPEGLAQARTTPPAEPAPAEPAPAEPPAQPVAESAADPVPITSLEYRGQEALRRALSLRQKLEDAIAADDVEAREQLEEVFDLMRLALE